MWLFRGAQSAIFYYAACTPCAEQLQRRKRKRDALRTARDSGRDALITDQPVFYQPSPFSTNTYWNEEIALGPGPPSRRGRNNAASRTGSQRNLASLDKPERAALTGVLEDIPVSADTKEVQGLGRRWNSVRYQRDDEALWGSEGKWSTTSLRATTKGSSKYSIDPPPEVNDLYPPIASALQTKEDIQWMLQPPPSAKVMEGKMRADTCSVAGSPLLRGVRASPSISARLDKEDRPSPARPRIAQRSETYSYGSTKSRKSPPATVAGSCGLIPIDSHISLSNTTVPSTHIIPLQQQQNRVNISSPHHDSHSNCSLEPKPDTSLPSLQHSHSSRHHRRNENDHRPTSKETVDSGTVFRPSTPSTPWLRATAHTNPSKFPITSTIHIDAVDPDHPIDEQGFDRLDHIRPYRWSMDF